MHILIALVNLLDSFYAFIFSIALDVSFSLNFGFRLEIFLENHGSLIASSSLILFSGSLIRNFFNKFCARSDKPVISTQS